MKILLLLPADLEKKKNEQECDKKTKERKQRDEFRGWGYVARITTEWSGEKIDKTERGKENKQMKREGNHRRLSSCDRGRAARIRRLS